MDEATLALAAGLLSASSLPLGAICAQYWSPTDRVVGMAMAFGAGALLAALTLDLVASVLARGDFAWLALGAVGGGVLFLALNRAVNLRGGFLRKVSTTVRHLRHVRQQHERRLRTHLLADAFPLRLAGDDADRLAAAFVHHTEITGMPLFRPGDPADELFLVESGAIELRDGARGAERVERIGPGQLVGAFAFVAGVPHGEYAVAASDLELWRLDRVAWVHLLARSPKLCRALRTYVQRSDFARSLRERTPLGEDAVARWVSDATEGLERAAPPPDALDAERARPDGEALSQLERMPILRGLPGAELDTLGACMLRKHYAGGEPIFREGDPAERLFVVERGSVLLVGTRLQAPELVRPRQAFGALSLLTGEPHTVTAVAGSEGSVTWELRKRDLEAFLPRSPELEARIKDYLRREDVLDYLELRQRLDRTRALQWIAQVTRSLDSSRSIPSAPLGLGDATAKRNAPLAIWLGILLDGIPESLVIGAHVVYASSSASLLAGLFLSNYPEALSSSVGMRQQGIPALRIVSMWGGLMLLTGLGAAVGNRCLIDAPGWMFSWIEGSAAGAMLTMIAETMLPEAYLRGGANVGLATLLGFLTAIFFSAH